MKSEITSGLACHLISMAVGSSLTAGSFILAFSVMSKGPITAEASYEPEANTKKQGIIAEDEESSLSGDEIAPNFSIASDTASTADAAASESVSIAEESDKGTKKSGEAKNPVKKQQKVDDCPDGSCAVQAPVSSGGWRLQVQESPDNWVTQASSTPVEIEPMTVIAVAETPAPEGAVVVVNDGSSNTRPEPTPTPVAETNENGYVLLSEEEMNDILNSLGW